MSLPIKKVWVVAMTWHDQYCIHGIHEEEEQAWMQRNLLAESTKATQTERRMQRRGQFVVEEKFVDPVRLPWGDHCYCITVARNGHVISAELEDSPENNSRHLIVAVCSRRTDPEAELRTRMTVRIVADSREQAIERGHQYRLALIKSDMWPDLDKHEIYRFHLNELMAYLPKEFLQDVADSVARYDAATDNPTQPWE